MYKGHSDRKGVEIMPLVSRRPSEFGVRSPVLTVLQKNKMFSPRPLLKLNIMKSLRDREVASSALDRQGHNPVSGDKGHLIHLTILVQFSLYVHKNGLRL